jgi:serine/threonine-protein kinase
MNRAIAAVIVYVCAFGVWPSAALAQPAGAQAEVLFRQGRDLLAAGKVAEACSAFEESQKLEPAVTTLLNLASCREQVGQFATAWGLFLDAARQTRSARDAATKKLHDVAQARALKLEPRVSRLTINVPLHSQFEGLEITRGTDRVDAGLWNRALPIDGGSYTITARAPGSNRWSTQVTVEAENDTKTVEIPDLRNLPRDLDKPAAPLPPPVITTATDPAPESPRAPSKIVPIVVGAGALALLGGGLGFELWAESRYDAAKSEMTSQSRRSSLYDSANTRRHVAAVFAVTGVAAGGAAVWLYLHGRNVERSGTSSASVEVVPTATGLALWGQF